MLRVEIDSAPPQVVLFCSGRIVLGVEAETLRCMAISRTEPQIVLDLREVHTMDAAGLGLLMELHCWALQRGRMLRLTNPSSPIRRLLALTRLESVFEITRDESIAPSVVVEDHVLRQAMTA